MAKLKFYLKKFLRRTHHHIGQRPKMWAILSLVAIFSLVTIPKSPINPLNTQAAAINPKDAQAVVKCSFRVFLNRTPDDDGSTYWQTYFVENNNDIRKLARQIASSREGKVVVNRTSLDDFIKLTYRHCLNRTPTTQEVNTWKQKYAQGVTRIDIFTFLVTVGDKPWQVATEVKCSKFNRGGSPTPLCKSGTAGTTRDVVTKTVPGSNLVVNKAWATNVEKLRGAAWARGFNLQGYRDPELPSWFKSPGSFRSYEEQKYLYEEGYPANPPGRSMHEWGQALDLSCNGVSIQRNRDCWNWVRANGPKYGVYNFTGITSPGQSEAWHFSSNAL